MVRAGVPSSQFKLKTLARDKSSTSYYILMDIAPDVTLSSPDPEVTWASWVIQNSAVLHGLEVQGVYWRKDPEVGMFSPVRKDVSELRIRAAQSRAAEAASDDLSGTRYAELTVH
jgi:hypothetical protein